MQGYYIINSILHKESCKKCQNALNNGGKFDRFESLTDVIEQNPAKACKCCLSEYKNFSEYYQLKQKRKEFYETMQLYVKHYGYTGKINDNEDYELTTAIEKWIIHIESFTKRGTAKITLYHKNNLNFKYNAKARKCGDSIYPEYHVQFVKELNGNEIINYAMHHETGKWGAEVVTAKKPVYQMFSKNTPTSISGGMNC